MSCSIELYRLTFIHIRLLNMLTDRNI